MFPPTAGSDSSEIASILATLCSYESVFGPRHSQTLHLRVELAAALGRAGQTHHARKVLESVVRETSPFHPGELRLHALRALREVLVLAREFEKAGMIALELRRLQDEKTGRNRFEGMIADDPVERVDGPAGERPSELAANAMHEEMKGQSL